MDVLQRVPHCDDFEAGGFQLRVGQCSQDTPKAELIADSFNGRRTNVQAGDIPALFVHACQEGAPAAAEVKQPALTLPQDFHVAPFRLPPEAQSVERSSSALSGSSMRTIDRRVEAANAIRAGTWVGKAETTALALDHREP